MAINFPSNPNVNDTHVVGSTIWTWDGSSWNGVSHDPIEIATLTYPSVDGTAGQLLITDGAGNLSFGNLSSATLSTVSIDALSDVDITSVAPTDGQVLVWDNASSTFIPGSNAGYSDSSVDTHLNTSAATSNQVLSWDGADYAWVAQSSGGGGTLGASITGVEESFIVKSNATGTVVHDCNDGHIFYHRTPSADWTVNLTNLGLTNHYATAVTIIIQQGATAYIPNALQIGGTSTEIRWASDTTPTGNADSTDQVTFSIMTDGTTTFALGQLSTYGQGTGTLYAAVPTGSAIAWGGDRGVFGRREWDYFSITTQGTATTSTGSLLVDGVRIQTSLASNGTNGYIGGGYMNDSPQYTATIEYIVFAVPGDDAVDFADLTQARSFVSAASDSTRGLFSGGTYSGPYFSSVDYITFASPSNATLFGNLSVSDPLQQAGFEDGTYAFFHGTVSHASKQIDQFTVQTTGNATNFGNVIEEKYSSTGCSDATRGLIGGGVGPVSSYLDTIEYITMATPGNAQSFGSLAATKERLAACENGVYGVFSGGSSNLGSYNDLEYVTIQTAGNATTVGQLVQGGSGNTMWSGAGSAS